MVWTVIFDRGQGFRCCCLEEEGSSVKIERTRFLYFSLSKSVYPWASATGNCVVTA